MHGHGLFDVRKEQLLTCIFSFKGSFRVARYKILLICTQKASRSTMDGVLVEVLVMLSLVALINRWAPPSIDPMAGLAGS